MCQDVPNKQKEKKQTAAVATLMRLDIEFVRTSGVPRNFFSGGGSTNSVEDRGQRERGSGGGSP